MLQPPVCATLQHTGWGAFTRIAALRLHHHSCSESARPRLASSCFKAPFPAIFFGQDGEQASLEVPRMPSKKGSRSSGKGETPQQAAAAPAPSGQEPLEPSEAASSTPSRDSPSTLTSVIGHVLSSFSFLDPSPPPDAPSNAGNLHQQESATSELSTTSTSSSQHWSTVRTAALHLPATIQDSLNEKSTENQDL